jgi:hypothetical protein
MPIVYKIDYSSQSAAGDTSIKIEEYEIAAQEYKQLQEERKQRQAEKKQENEAKDSVPQPSPEPKLVSTYKQLSFKLSSSDQEKGCLVVGEGDSKAFFRYEETGMVQESLVKRLDNGVFINGFIGAKGEFEGFKFLPSRETYELKRANGQRVEFQRTGETLKILDNVGGEYDVPCWEAITPCLFEIINFLSVVKQIP